MFAQIDIEKILFLAIETVPQYPTYSDVPERFQKLWFENHQIKELNVKLQDRIEDLEEILRFEQDFK